LFYSRLNWTSFLIVFANSFASFAFIFIFISISAT
jgi:hypothetical protein